MPCKKYNNIILCDYIIIMQSEVNINVAPDELKETIVAKLPSENMNTYSNKFHTDMILSQSAKSTVRVTDSASGDDTLERYSINSINPTDFYLTKIVRETNMSYKVVALKTKQDYTQFVNSISTSPAINYTFTVAPEDTPATITTVPKSNTSSEIAGNPNPFTGPVFGVATDACNAGVSKSSVNMGENSYSVDYASNTEVIYDIEARRLNKNICYNDYNGILIPDKMMTKQYIIPCDKVNTEWTAPTASDAAAKITSRRSLFKTNSLLAKYSELDQDKTNSLNSNQRGKLMRKPNKSNQKYKFNKGLSTQSRTFDPVTREWNLTATNTQTLDSFKVGNEYFPSDLPKCQELYDTKALPFYDIVWFTDSIRPVYAATKAADPSTDMTLAFVSEPSGQTLEIEINLDEVKSPVYNPILKYETISSWARTGKFILELTLEPNRRQLWSSQFDLSNSPNLKVTTSFKKSSILLYQSTNKQLSSYVQPKISIPFRYPGLIQRQPFKVSEIEKQDIIEYRFVQKYTQLPNDVLFFLDRAGGKIIDYQVILQHGSNVLTGAQMSDLLAVTREKFESFTEEDMTGYNVSWNKSNNNIGSWSRGDVLYLRMGEDIPLQDEFLLPNVANINLNVEYVISIKPNSLGETGEKIVSMHFINYFNSFYTIENSTCGIASNIYTQDDIVKAYTKIKGQISTNELYVNTNSFFGSGLSQIWAKLKHVIPKLYRTGKLGKEIHDDMKEPTQEMKKHVKTNVTKIRDLMEDFN